MLADLLRRRRRARGLTLREAAGLIGISPAYLSSLEHGRNPSTGRPPVPSPPVLAGIARALAVDLETLLPLAGAALPASAHVLLVQLGRASASALEGARRAGAGPVDEWLELSAPLGLAAEGHRYDPAGAVDALASRLAGRRTGDGRVGLVFGAGARPLGRVADPADLLAAEETWEDDVAHACLEPLGRAPAANVCVYRLADIRNVRAGDPLAVALALVRAHPHVAAQADDGEVATGAAAIEALLVALRPDAVEPATWTELTAAAARGLGRWTPRA